MPRINIDLDFIDHPKTLSISPLAQLLFIRSIIYSAKHLTDGFIPRGAKMLLAHNLTLANILPDLDLAHPMLKEIGDIDIDALVRELETVGWWKTTSDGKVGWYIHDYLEYQLSREEVEAVKKSRADASRKNGKRGGRPPRNENNQQLKYNEEPTENLDSNLGNNLDNNLGRNLEETYNNPTNTNTNTKKKDKEDKDPPEPELGLGVEKPKKMSVEDIRIRWNAVDGVKPCKRIEGALRIRIGNLLNQKSATWWDELFMEIARSKFLTGKALAKEGKKPFQVDLEWATGPINLGKILSGKYDDSSDAKKRRAVF